jgi:hypothetical protein
MILENTAAVVKSIEKEWENSRLKLNMNPSYN